ncbi:MAG: hypothetical protein ACLP29_14335 [Dissulfurispiraceae bacterium]
MKLRRSRQSLEWQKEIIATCDVLLFIPANLTLASFSLQSLHSLSGNLSHGKATTMQSSTPDHFDHHESNGDSNSEYLGDSLQLGSNSKPPAECGCMKSSLLLSTAMSAVHSYTGYAKSAVSE